jgi:transposase
METMMPVSWSERRTNMAPHGYRSGRTYSPEVRTSAVAMVEAGTPISAVAESLAIPRKSIVNWVNRAKQQSQAARPAADPPTYEALEAEVAALRAELTQLKEDNDLLGKASAYFARHAQTQRS